MNAHDAVVSAVLTALRQDPAVTAGLIEEDADLELLPEGLSEAVLVSLEDSDPRDQFTSQVHWLSRVAISCRARVNNIGSTGRASRDLHARVYARLMQDRRLGGAVVDVGEPRIRHDSAQADTRVGNCTGIYPVLHITSSGSLQA